MRRFRIPMLLSLILPMILAFPGFGLVSAQQLAPATITSFDISTVDGKSVKDAPLMVGSTYKVNFTIQVAAGLKEDCVMKTSLELAPSADRYWTLKGTYPGIDLESWHPAQPKFSFQAVEGTAQLELVGSVPADYVSQSLGDAGTLNLGKKISIIELSLASGTVIGDRQVEVVNTTIEEYLSALNAKKTLLTNTEADPAYSELVKSLITRAEAEAKIGYTDLAMGTLNSIPNSGWVKPQGSTLYQWIIMGVLAIISALFLFLLLKARSEIGFFRRQTDSQAQSLQILAKKASLIGDPSLSAGIQQLQKELEQTMGGY